MAGQSIKQIAITMNLSPRTIEHYLEKIRQMLGCRSNRELITSYLQQLSTSEKR
jgi:DNA-binding CsgD family transcriptional regulator